MSDVAAEAAEEFAGDVRRQTSALDMRIRRIIREEIRREIRTGAIAASLRSDLDRSVEDLIIEGQARLKAVS